MDFCYQLLDIAEIAGCEILKIYARDDISVDSKSDNSPVTEADLAADRVIRSRLLDQFDIPVVSEETAVDDEKRLSWSRFWLVDPLDGTKNFIAGDGEFTVNIALIDDHKPVVGVVYLPVSGEFYFAELGQGAFRRDKNGDEPVRNTRTTSDLVCAVSKFHNTPATEEFCRKHGITKTASYGSSLKLCKLAEGAIDVYPRLAPTKEWDTAAAHCIVSEAGGKVLDLETREPLRYNKQSIINNYFVASRNDLNFFESP